MAVSSQWSAQQWVSSQECHGLCRLLAALRVQGAAAGLIEVLAREGSLPLKPRDPFIFAVLDDSDFIKYIDVDTLTVIHEQNLLMKGDVHDTGALEATCSGLHLAVSTFSKGKGKGGRPQGFEIIAFGIDSCSELGSRRCNHFVDSLAFAPDEKNLIAGVRGGHLHLLHAQSLDQIRDLQLEGHSSSASVYCMKYTADGTRVVVSIGASVCLLDGLIMSVLQTVQLELEPGFHAHDFVQFRDECGHEHVAFRSGRLRITCLDVDTLAVSQEVQLQTKGYNFGIPCFAFTPKGLAVKSGEPDLHLLEFPSLRLVAECRLGNGCRRESWLRYVESRSALELALQQWALRVERTFLCYMPLTRNANSVVQSTTEAVGQSEVHYGHYRGENPRRCT